MRFCRSPTVFSVPECGEIRRRKLSTLRPTRTCVHANLQRDKHGSTSCARCSFLNSSTRMPRDSGSSRASAQSRSIGGRT